MKDKFECKKGGDPGQKFSVLAWEQFKVVSSVLTTEHQNQNQSNLGSKKNCISSKAKQRKISKKKIKRPRRVKKNNNKTCKGRKGARSVLGRKASWIVGRLNNLVEGSITVLKSEVFGTDQDSDQLVIRNLMLEEKNNNLNKESPQLGEILTEVENTEQAVCQSEPIIKKEKQTFEKFSEKKETKIICQKEMNTPLTPTKVDSVDVKVKERGKLQSKKSQFLVSKAEEWLIKCQLEISKGEDFLSQRVNQKREDKKKREKRENRLKYNKLRNLEKVNLTLQVNSFLKFMGDAKQPASFQKKLLSFSESLSIDKKSCRLVGLQSKKDSIKKAILNKNADLSKDKLWADFWIILESNFFAEQEASLFQQIGGQIHQESFRRLTQRMSFSQVFERLGLEMIENFIWNKDLSFTKVEHLWIVKRLLGSEELLRNIFYKYQYVERDLIYRNNWNFWKMGQVFSDKSAELAIEHNLINEPPSQDQDKDMNKRISPKKPHKRIRKAKKGNLPKKKNLSDLNIPANQRVMNYYLGLSCKYLLGFHRLYSQKWLKKKDLPKKFEDFLFSNKINRKSTFLGDKKFWVEMALKIGDASVTQQNLSVKSIMSSKMGAFFEDERIDYSKGMLFHPERRIARVSKPIQKQGRGIIIYKRIL